MAGGWPAADGSPRLGAPPREVPMPPRRPRRVPRPRAGPRSGIDRRTFVQGAAAAAAPLVFGCATGGAAGTLAAPAVIGARERKLPPEVLKVGLIGCGGRGTGAAANALSAENGTVVLTAMADVLPGRIEGSLAGLKET